jgi:hypothetical protein
VDIDHTLTTLTDNTTINAALTASTGTPPIVDTLAYPISPEYVTSWTPVRGACELIANALDEDPKAQVRWTDGHLTITDNGPGIPEEGLILGYSSKTPDQIGQFGEGKKLAMLILARSSEIGATRCDTVGYGFIPTVDRRRLFAELVPSRSEQGAEVLVYHLFRTDRTRGTTITIECPEALAKEAIGRFRSLTEPGYTTPTEPGSCVLTGDPGRVWIGGVYVNTMPGFLASYDLPLTDKGLQNRDRTVIDDGALRHAIHAILASCRDEQVIDRFARHILAGGRLRGPEQFFAYITDPHVRAAWRAWARQNLPAQTFYTASGNEEAALDLRDRGFSEVAARGLSDYERTKLMAMLGVEVARRRQEHHYQKTQSKTTWVSERSLPKVQQTVLREACRLVRTAIGPFALDQVKVYSHSDAVTCSLGFYSGRTGQIAVHQDTLTDRHVLLGTLLHEAAHRVAHRGGGRWLPAASWCDHSQGFEHMLTEFAAVLLTKLADPAGLPDATDPPDSPIGQTEQRSPADNTSLPASRRELARLLTDWIPHAVAAGGFSNAKDLVASTAVHYDYWHTLTHPRPVGFRQWGAGARAWDYDKVAVLAEAVGLYPPVVWLGYNLCEGPLHGRPRDQWGKPGPWKTRISTIVQRACADLEALGGPYAEQVPALGALVRGDTATPTGDDSWQAPVRRLVALERERLGLDANTPA